MEQIRLTMAIAYSGMQGTAQITKLLVGQEEVLVEGRSIMQVLEEMQQQGWTLTTSRAKADRVGILCEYDFQRPLSTPKSADAVNETSTESHSTH